MQNEYAHGTAVVDNPNVDASLVHLMIPLNQRQAKHLDKRTWCLFFLDTCRDLAQLELTGQEWSVLMSLLSYMEFGNKICVVQSNLAKDLGVAPARISEAIKKLLKANVLIEDGKVGATRTFRFNSQYVYRGSTRNVRKTQREDSDHVEQLTQVRQIDDEVSSVCDEIASQTKGLNEEEAQQLTLRIATDAIDRLDEMYCSEMAWEPERYDFGAAIIRKIAEKFGLPSPV